VDIAGLFRPLEPPGRVDVVDLAVPTEAGDDPVAVDPHVREGRGTIRSTSSSVSPGMKTARRRLDPPGGGNDAFPWRAERGEQGARRSVILEVF
jgi:hypothetical protein